MFKYKLINLSFFGVALLIAPIFPNLNLVSAKNVLITDVRTSQILPPNLSDEDLTKKIIKPIQQQTVDSSLLIGNANAAAEEITNAQSKPRVTQKVSLSLLLILLISVGIFYPLFLFYRQLLNGKPKKSGYPPEQDNKSQFTKSETPIIFDFPVKEDVSIATVSKLQIAFSPQALRLRHKLEQISSSEDLNMDQDIVDLMCKTVLALVSQQDWTHVNYSSVSLPRKEIQAEFRLISQAERNKFLSKELSIINQHQQGRENYNHDAYRYVVVTLVFCTTHDAPLFSKINTEEQLIEELGKLGKMNKDALIEFELLWNPQQKDKYLTNDQLLTKYSDMVRLL